MNGNLVGDAIMYVVPAGSRAGCRLAEVYLDLGCGRSLLRHYVHHSPDPGLRAAARVLYELYRDVEPLPESDLADELHDIAALIASRDNS